MITIDFSNCFNAQRCLFRVKVLKLQLTFDETIEFYTTLYDTFMLSFDGKQLLCI